MWSLVVIYAASHTYTFDFIVLKLCKFESVGIDMKVISNRHFDWSYDNDQQPDACVLPKQHS